MFLTRRRHRNPQGVFWRNCRIELRRCSAHLFWSLRARRIQNNICISPSLCIIVLKRHQVTSKKGEKGRGKLLQNLVILCVTVVAKSSNLPFVVRSQLRKKKQNKNSAGACQDTRHDINKDHKSDKQITCSVCLSRSLPA